MIDVDDGFALPEAPDLAVFPDADRAGLFHILPLRLIATGPDGALAGQLIVTGRGGVKDDRAVSGAFWTLTLTPAADRERLAAILSTDATPARLISAEADVTVEVTLAPGVTGGTGARDWRGTPLIVQGQVTGPSAAALRQAWGAGLPDAAAEMVLTLAGGTRRVARATATRARRIAWDTHRDTSSATVDLTATRATPRRLTRRFALDLRPAQTRASLFHTGFDPT